LPFADQHPENVSDHHLSLSVGAASLPLPSLPLPLPLRWAPSLRDIPPSALIHIASGTTNKQRRVLDVPHVNGPGTGADNLLSSMSAKTMPSLPSRPTSLAAGSEDTAGFGNTSMIGEGKPDEKICDGVAWYTSAAAKTGVDRNLVILLTLPASTSRTFQTCTPPSSVATTSRSSFCANLTHIGRAGKLKVITGLEIGEASLGDSSNRRWISARRCIRISTLHEHGA
jgi:hypothetical protein